MRRVYKWLLLCLGLLWASPLHAQYTKLQGWCENGAPSVNIQGTQGSGAQKIQQSYPACTVTVFDAGTVNQSTIYADSIGTAKANPFAASNAAQWFFYGTPGNHYDVRFSNAGIAAPFTLGDQIAPVPNNFTINGGFCDVKANGGAKGDGSTDDTSAIQSCATQLNTKFGGGTIIFQAGTYCVSGVDLTTGFSSTVGWTIQGTAATTLSNNCTGVRNGTKPTLRFGGNQSRIVGNGMNFTGYNDPTAAQAPVIQVDSTCVAQWTCGINDVVISAGRGGIQSFGQVSLYRVRINASYGDYIAEFGSNLHVLDSQIDTQGAPQAGCALGNRSQTFAVWSPSLSVNACQIVEIGAQSVSVTNAVWSNTSGGQTTFTLSAPLAGVVAGGTAYIDRVVSTGGTGRGFNGYFIVVSNSGTSLVVTQAAASSVGTYSSGGVAANQGYFLAQANNGCTTGASSPAAAPFGTAITDNNCSYLLLGPADLGGNGIHIYGGSNHEVIGSDITGYFAYDVRVEDAPNGLLFLDNTPSNGISGGYYFNSGYNIQISDKGIANCVNTTCIGITFTAAFVGDVTVTNSVIYQVGKGIDWLATGGNLSVTNNIFGGNTTGVAIENSTANVNVGLNTFGSITWGNNSTNDVTIGTGVTTVSVANNLCLASSPGISNSSTSATVVVNLNRGCGNTPGFGLTVTSTGAMTATLPAGLAISPDTDNGKDLGLTGTRWRNLFATGVNSGASDLTVTPNLAILPSADSTKNLGNATTRWLNLYTAAIHGGAGTVTVTNNGGSVVAFGNGAGGGVLIGASGGVPTTAGQLAMTNVLLTYNNVNTVSDGISYQVAKADATTQAANISVTTVYAVPASGAGLYRASCYVVVTQAATNSSTLPNCGISWTDNDSNVASGPLNITNTNTGNVPGSGGLAAGSYYGVVTLDARASTNISYSTANYASNGATPMQYAIHVRIERMGN